MLVFFTNLIVMEFQVTYLVFFLLSSVIDSFRQFWMASICKNIQLMLELFKAPFLVLFLLNMNDFLDDVIYDIAINADGTTLYSKCDQKSNLWQQLELAFERGSDL